jgi:hypothetical protein
MKTAAAAGIQEQIGGGAWTIWNFETHERRTKSTNTLHHTQT